jgi:hypothetical protein
MRDHARQPECSPSRRRKTPARADPSADALKSGKRGPDSAGAGLEVPSKPRLLGAWRPAAFGQGLQRCVRYLRQRFSSGFRFAFFWYAAVFLISLGYKKHIACSSPSSAAARMTHAAGKAFPHALSCFSMVETGCSLEAFGNEHARLCSHAPIVLRNLEIRCPAGFPEPRLCQHCTSGRQSAPRPRRRRAKEIVANRR